jgi:hypothetical protein
MAGKGLIYSVLCFGFELIVLMARKIQGKESGVGNFFYLFIQ